eukprot:CAMPEP_0194762854 /NCGR_PEP_ID=MMETSP0323_2-20130528/17055_1 /TAXON_ID=2866 ORGANISM="Crypthecodinium cohnii, Strain Seligo" /NCGR_SAMPLE_ID=MMETSP0323_2 /ASSEMBLY_ACC=CAM_ASM_000346 /LENGTH=47 /DNA_ID= /DNA_START= /DNA_END= /DNA_ORIENTATION=
MADGDQEPTPETKKEVSDDGSWMDGLWAVGFVLAVVASMGASWYLHR